MVRLGATMAQRCTKRALLLVWVPCCHACAVGCYLAALLHRVDSWHINTFFHTRSLPAVRAGLLAVLLHRYGPPDVIVGVPCCVVLCCAVLSPCSLTLTGHSS